jgi:hypothetical protein
MAMLLSFHCRRAASQTLQAMDEEGLTTSLVGGDFRYKLEVGLDTSIPDTTSTSRQRFDAYQNK